jgi:LPS-assembly protein
LNLNLNSQINPIIALDSSLPFAKISKDSEQHIIPRVLARYSLGATTNATANNTYLNTDNIFSINRMNSDELVEKNLSLNIGLDWIWKEKTEVKKIPTKAEVSIGQVIKFNKDPDMPIKSSLQNKSSDFVTKINYLSPGNFEILLKNTLDRQLNHAYYNDLNVKTFINQGEINFNLYEKNNYLGNERYANANLITYLSENTKIKNETYRNLRTDLTNSHKLGIENEN